MHAPEWPHVRIHDGWVYIERVPNIWVRVCEAADYTQFTEAERNFMVSRALHLEPDRSLPTP